MNDLEKAERDVAELIMAHNVCHSEGGRLTGEHLLRFRQLPEVEKRYFTRLTAPIVDEYAMTRIGVSEPETKSIQRRIVYVPPFPEPCECHAPAFYDYGMQWCRCVRCLSSWPLDRREWGNHEMPIVKYPLIESVEKHHMGHAIELFKLKDQP